MKFLRYGFLLAWFILPLSYASANLNEDSAKEFIGNIGDELSQLLQDEALSDDIYFARVRALLKQNLDLSVIGQFLLGSYGRGLDDSVKEDFSQTLEDYIVLIYGLRLKEYYAGEALIIDSALGEGKSYLVHTHISGNDDVSVTWRLYQDRNGEIRIIDVLLSGISMVVSQRDEFSAIIRNNNNDVKILMEKMRQQIQKAE